MYIISTGVIAFGILGGNLTFNILQCKQWNSSNITNNVVDHVCLHEWCNGTCHTSSKRINIIYNDFMRAIPMLGLLVTASPWIILAVLCTSITLYYLLLPHHSAVDDSVYDIEVSLSALSLDWHDEHNNSNHSNTSWFSELNKLDLLTVDPSLPVTMDTISKQIISPPKLKLHQTCSFQTNQWNKRMSGDNHSVSNKQYYIIITLLCLLLLLSVTCNIVLIYWIT